jgi:hypothetical protein
VRFRPSQRAAADTLRPLLYGDAPMSLWPDARGASTGGPWANFERARALAEAGDVEGAQDLWRGVTRMRDVESRHVLQAWHYLRASGESPPHDVAAEVLGAVVEVPVGPGHDVLAAYADGSLRYLNHSGKVAVIDTPGSDELRDAAGDWLATARQLAAAIGAWQAVLPNVPQGHARVLMLTPSGPRFGQGPFDALAREAAAGVFLAAATRVLQLVVRSAT